MYKGVNDRKRLPVSLHTVCFCFPERDKEGGVKRTNKLKEEVSETRLMSGQPQTQSTTKTQTDNAASSLSNNPSLKQNSSPSKTYKNEVWLLYSVYSWLCKPCRCFVSEMPDIHQLMDLTFNCFKISL